MSDFSFEFNGEVIPYSVIRRKNMKNIRITAKNGEVVISAPKFLSLKRINEFVSANKTIICDIYSRCHKSAPIRDGCILSVLGEDYQVFLIESGKNSTEIEQDRILIYTDDIDNDEQTERIFLELLRGISKQVFPEMLGEAYALFKTHKIPFPKLRIQKMTSRWGSCRAGNASITLNLYLAAAPKKCIEYVIIHELCHLIHQNHSKAFWHEVESVMPDFLVYKKYLNENIRTQISPKF